LGYAIATPNLLRAWENKSIDAGFEVISIRRQEAGGRRQEEEEFSLPKKKSETIHIKGFSPKYMILSFSKSNK